MSDPQAVHASALIIDTHADTPQRFADEGWDFLDPLGTGHLNLDAARRGNLAAEFFALWAEPSEWRGRFAERTFALLDAVLEQIRRHPAELALCTSPADIVAAHAARKFGILLGVEGGHSIENSLDLLRRYYALGVRYMTLTWANHNAWAESSGGQDSDGQDPPVGLTAFGHEVIAEMNRLGMIIDVSHASDRTLADVLAATRAPILATHSCARALTPSPRNLTDGQLRAIAANGGAVMVNFYSAFVDESYRQQAWGKPNPERIAAQQALKAEYAARGLPVPFHASNAIDREFARRIPRPPLAALIAHFDHIIRVAGIDHVGIGTDFDGISSLPEGIESAADLPKVTEALMRLGYGAEEMRKLLGGNLLRVFSDVQRAAGESREQAVL